MRAPASSSVSCGLAVAAQLGAADELHHVGAAVVFDDLALALDELVGRARRGVTLLPEKGALARLGRHHTVLEAVGILAHLQLRAAQHDGALGHDHTAGENAGLLELIVAQGIGLDVHGLVAVGFFGVHQRRCGQRQGQRCGAGQEEEGQSGSHRGHDLAVIVLTQARRRRSGSHQPVQACHRLPCRRANRCAGIKKRARRRARRWWRRGASALARYANQVLHHLQHALHAAGHGAVGVVAAGHSHGGNAFHLVAILQLRRPYALGWIR